MGLERGELLGSSEDRRLKTGGNCVEANTTRRGQGVLYHRLGWLALARLCPALKQ